MNWTKKKPDIPCVFVTRSKYKDKWSYQIFKIKKTPSLEEDAYYLGWFTNDGDEYDGLKYLTADEYLILEATNE